NAIPTWMIPVACVTLMARIAVAAEPPYPNGPILVSKTFTRFGPIEPMVLKLPTSSTCFRVRGRPTSLDASLSAFFSEDVATKSSRSQTRCCSSCDDMGGIIAAAAARRAWPRQGRGRARSDGLVDEAIGAALWLIAQDRRAENPAGRGARAAAQTYARGSSTVPED